MWIFFHSLWTFETLILRPNFECSTQKTVQEGQTLKKDNKSQMFPVANGVSISSTLKPSIRHQILLVISSQTFT
jgi:hypothetical protein